MMEEESAAVSSSLCHRSVSQDGLHHSPASTWEETNTTTGANNRWNTYVSKLLWWAWALVADSIKSICAHIGVRHHHRLQISFLLDKDNLLKWERHFHPCPLIGLQETEGHLELVVWHFDWFLIFSDPNHPPGCQPLMIYSSTELLLNDVDPNFQYQSWHIRRWIQEEAISDWRRHQFKTYSKVLAFSSMHSVTNSGRLVCSFHLSFPTIVKENTRQVPRLTW